jgi:hypothetical protein
MMECLHKCDPVVVAEVNTKVRQVAVRHQAVPNPMTQALAVGTNIVVWCKKIFMETLLYILIPLLLLRKKNGSNGQTQTPPPPRPTGRPSSSAAGGAYGGGTGINTTSVYGATASGFPGFTQVNTGQMNTPAQNTGSPGGGRPGGL